MTPDRFHDFFIATGGVAGTLIGLLFVAISVAPERLTGPDANQTHRVRASAALTAFVNALTVSLFALIPDIRIGWPVLSVAAIGLFFVAGSLASLLRARGAEPRALLDASFLIGLLVLFALQLDFGIRAVHHPHGGPFNSIAVLVVVCFLIGISRSWELIGGPSTSVRRELAETIRARRAPEGSARDDSPR